MKYSVIDVSSNSLSLIVADVDGRSPQNAEIIFKQRENLSLLTYTEGSNLGKRGVEKLIDAILSAKNACRRMGVKRVYLIATAVMRNISNIDEVEAAVTEKTGMVINYIDGNTEAYCDYVANVYYASVEKSVLVDLGGKSIEICDLSKTDKGDMLCLNFGILDLRRKFVKRIQPDEDEGKNIKKYVKQKFDEAELPKEGAYNTIVLAGPVCAAIYGVYCEYVGITPSDDGQAAIDIKTFRKMVKYLLTDSGRSGLILSAAPEKLALVAPAAVVLRNLFKRFGAENVIVSERGVKEGYLKLVLSGEETGVRFDFDAEDAKLKEKKKAESTANIAETTQTVQEESKEAEQVSEDKTEDIAEEQTEQQTEEQQNEGNEGQAE